MTENTEATETPAYTDHDAQKEIGSLGLEGALAQTMVAVKALERAMHGAPKK